MSLILFVILPLSWAVTGKLLGLAISASRFYSAAGKRVARSVSKWCTPIFPIVYLVLLVVGGDARIGVQLFGSSELFGILGGAPVFAVPLLALYAGAIYVIRDLTLGRDHADLVEER